MKRNKHLGDSFDSFLENESIKDEVKSIARKRLKQHEEEAKLDTSTASQAEQKVIPSSNGKN